MRALLDVNVLIALLDSDHVLHSRGTRLVRRPRQIRMGVLPDYSKRMHPRYVTPGLSEWIARARNH